MCVSVSTASVKWFMSIWSLLNSSTRHPTCTRDFCRTVLSTLCTTKARRVLSTRWLQWRPKKPCQASSMTLREYSESSSGATVILQGGAQSRYSCCWQGKLKSTTKSKHSASSLRLKSISPSFRLTQAKRSARPSAKGCLGSRYPSRY